MRSNGWHGVDLDGTLAKKLTPFDPSKIGAPVQLMVDRIKWWLACSEEVRILTARVAPASVEWHGYPIDKSVKLIQDWTEVIIGVRLAVTCEKDVFMLDLYDDLAVRVEVDTGRIL